MRDTVRDLFVDFVVEVQEFLRKTKVPVVNLISHGLYFSLFTALIAAVQCPVPSQFWPYMHVPLNSKGREFEGLQILIGD